MSGLLPAAVFGLEVPNGDVMVPAIADFPAAFRITMAALDPTAPPEFVGDVATSATPRATLKLLRQPLEESEDDLDSLDLPSDEDDSDLDSDEDEEVNGGPSDPSKTKKARKQAALESLKEAFANGDDQDDDDMALDGDAGLSKKKGKGKAVKDEEDDSDEDDDDDEELEMEEYVVCTLDPNHHYQQPLEITIGEDERVYFKVSGTHKIYLTGNYVIPVDDGPRRSFDPEDDDDYDLYANDGELDDELDDEDEESDELDDMDDPRVTELDSDEDEVPKLVQKSKNKRPAADSDEEEATLDDMLAKALKSGKPAANGEKLSKKQQKKLKNNQGEAVGASAIKAEADGPAGKKVSFAKNLEQGPTGTTLSTEKKVNGTTVEKTKVTAQKESSPKGESKAKDDKSKGGVGVTVVSGVKIDVKKAGSGPAAKKNSKVSMRYIGKLKDGKQFDANKKGKPFTFTLGRGEVIKGWEIGLDGIRAGDERRITIPANLAYGKKALPGIPANSDLIFDVKCLEVN